MNNTLVQYIRDKHNNPIGVLCALTHHYKPVVGWSYTNVKAGDRFNKELGLRIAMNRARSGKNGSKVPHAITKNAIKFVDRARRYFKIQDIDVTVLGFDPDVILCQNVKKIQDNCETVFDELQS